jgi:hypothetical protein
VTILVRNIDLAVGVIDVTNTTLDEQTLTLSGSVSVEIRNSGAETVNSPYQLLIYVLDLQHNEISMELGQYDLSGSLAAGDTITVDVPVAGAILFKDTPIYAFVDSANIITESNEANNIAHNLVDCQMEPSEPGTFTPVLEWEWTGSEVMPSHIQVMSTPVVANLNDDNNDGRIDQHDIPDIIFNTFSRYNSSPGEPCYSDGILRAISGDGTGELFCRCIGQIQVRPLLLVILMEMALLRFL